MSQTTRGASDAQIGTDADTADVLELLANVDGVEYATVGRTSGCTHVCTVGDVPREVFDIAGNAGLSPRGQERFPRRLVLTFEPESA